MNKGAIIAEVERWLEQVVVGLNLCPFARKPSSKGLVRFSVSEARDDENLLAQMAHECSLLMSLAAEELETTLIIVPDYLQDFDDFNQFLDLADGMVDALDYRGHLQLASFHPRYQFANTQPQEAENLTNCAPYPVLHLIREASIERVLANYPDPEAIPGRNIARVKALSESERKQLFPYWFG